MVELFSQDVVKFTLQGRVVVKLSKCKDPQNLVQFTDLGDCQVTQIIQYSLQQKKKNNDILLLGGGGG